MLKILVLKDTRTDTNSYLWQRAPFINNGMKSVLNRPLKFRKSFKQDVIALKSTKTFVKISKIPLAMLKILVLKDTSTNTNSFL